jgi:hypothetical protein
MNTRCWNLEKQFDNIAGNKTHYMSRRAYKHSNSMDCNMHSLNFKTLEKVKLQLEIHVPDNWRTLKLSLWLVESANYMNCNMHSIFKRLEKVEL